MIPESQLVAALTRAKEPPYFSRPARGTALGGGVNPVVPLRFAAG